MIQVNFSQAKERFLEITERVLQSKNFLIEPLVRMTAAGNEKKERVFGSAKGLIKIAPDFDEPLEDFQEYI